MLFVFVYDNISLFYFCNNEQPQMKLKHVILLHIGQLLFIIYKVTLFFSYLLTMKGPNENGSQI